MYMSGTLDKLREGVKDVFGLSPNIHRYILLTVLHIFLMLLVDRI